MTGLFVYGTLRPGEARWQHLAPFVVGEGVEASVPGQLYDTGLDYPAAIFGGAEHIFGRVFTLNEARLPEALAHLDEVEGAVRGLYERVEVQTAAGDAVWAYQCGDTELLRSRITSGDWQQRSRTGPA